MVPLPIRLQPMSANLAVIAIWNMSMVSSAGGGSGDPSDFRMMLTLTPDADIGLDELSALSMPR